MPGSKIAAAYLCHPIRQSNRRPSKVRERLALGQDTGADQWLAQAQPALTDDLNRVRESSHLIAVHVLLAQGRAAEALPLLKNITQHAETAGRMKIVVESCILATLAHHQQDNPRAALAALHRALTVAEPKGYIRSFVNEGETIRQIIRFWQAGGARAG